MDIIRKCIIDIFNDKYLIEKLSSLKSIKGIESDLRFLFEKSFFKHTGKIPETEVENRTDLKLPLNPKYFIEIKCYDGILSVKDTTKKIKDDFRKLLKKANKGKSVFIYFGLYGKTQPPNLTKTKQFVPQKRINEISEELKAIQNLASEEDVKIDSSQYYCCTLSDRILYAAWFYLKPQKA